MRRTTRDTEPDRSDFMRSWGNPENANYARSLEAREYRYELLYDLYDGTAYHTIRWSEYKKAYGLYRKIRQVWDHAHEIVEFYATHIWSGSLAKDGLNLPDGVPNAIPLAEDTNEKLASAIGQLWSWWNWQQNMVNVVRYTAALGELLVELVDDVESGKIMINLVWPGYVTDVRMDDAGHLKYYCVEYTYFDREDGRTHRYKREVDSEYFRTYRDGEPWDYILNPIPEGTEPDRGRVIGDSVTSYVPGSMQEDEPGHEIPNPYGFVPAVLFRHHRTMGVRGEPAIWSTQAQLDEINSLFAHILDKTNVQLEAPIVVSGNIQHNRLQTAFANMFGSVKRTFTAELDEGPADETLNIVQGPQGTTVSTIQLEIGDADIALGRMIKSIEKKCPEIIFYSELRSMTQLTGPSANSLLGDVDRKVRMVAGGYDSDMIRLLQMGIALAGWRFAEGADGWSEKTEDQQKFAPFNLDSYKKGDLDFDIMPRMLIPTSAKEKVELVNAKKNALPFIPGDELAKEVGYDQETAQGWLEDYEAKEEEKLAQQMQKAQQQNGFQAKRGPGAPPGGPGGQRTQSRRREETQSRERRRAQDR